MNKMRIRRIDSLNLAVHMSYHATLLQACVAALNDGYEGKDLPHLIKCCEQNERNVLAAVRDYAENEKP